MGSAAIVTVRAQSSYLQQAHLRPIDLFLTDCAYLQGHADCAELLAKAGCDMSLIDGNGETGKQIAERMGRSAHLKLLTRLRVAEKQLMS